jgi:hypothetical protein
MLAEGKGANILDALHQFHAAQGLLERRRQDPGPTIGAIIVVPRLRYLQWNNQRLMWVAYLDSAEEVHITARLQGNIAQAQPTLQKDKVYLLDGPEDDKKLPSWAINPQIQPFTVYVDDRRLPSARGQFRPLQLGSGTLQVYYVA